MWWHGGRLSHGVHALKSHFSIMDHDGLFDDEDFFSNPMDSFSTLRDIEDMVIFGTNSSQEDGTTR